MISAKNDDNFIGINYFFLSVYVRVIIYAIILNSSKETRTRPKATT